MAQARNYQEEAYIAIKTAILKLVLKPGSRINKQALETKLKIGATPIREALLRLRREDLITVKPQSGTFVSKISVDQVYQARFVRESIEALVVEECAQHIDAGTILELHKLLALQKVYLDAADYDQFFNMDERFHETFYNTEHKQFVWQWLQVINLQFNRFRYLRLEIKALNWQEILEDHEKIVQSIEDHDAPAAKAATAKHLHMVDSDLVVAEKAHPDYFTA